MVPVHGGRAVLLSIDGSGASDPYARMPVISEGPVKATTSVGSGPLLFFDQRADGCYLGIHPAPPGPHRSVGEIIESGRPCPSSYLHGDGDAALQQPDNDSSTKGLLDTTTMEATTSSRGLQAQAVTPGSPILALLRRDWGMEFYIRVDHGGSFHTYPDVGGSFQSLQQAENAIDRYLHGRRDSTMCMERAGVSPKEMGIRQCLYWPDGTKKRRTKSLVLERALEHTCRLVRAVVDQYNEDHNLLGDLAYEFKEVVHHESFRGRTSLTAM